jgi:hypothetical protein
MKLFLSIATFLLLNHLSVADNEKLTGCWKVIKMESSGITYDLEHLDSSRSSFLAKLKEKTTAWTKNDSLSGDIGFNLVIDMLREMSITFKKGNLFSMKISKKLEIVDGQYDFDKTNNNLILKDINDTLQYKVLSISDNRLVLLTIDNDKSTITYKRQQ